MELFFGLLLISWVFVFIIALGASCRDHAPQEYYYFPQQIREEEYSTVEEADIMGYFYTSPISGNNNVVINGDNNIVHYYPVERIHCIRCKFCGKLFEIDTKGCPNCGAKL